MPVKTPKTFSAHVLFLRNERNKILLEKVIEKIEASDSKYPANAKNFKKALTKRGDFYILSKTNLEQLCEAIKGIKNNTAYKGAYGFKATDKNDTLATGNTIILNDDYEIVINEDNTFKTAGSLKGSSVPKQALPSTNGNITSVVDDIEKIKNFYCQNEICCVYY